MQCRRESERRVDRVTADRLDLAVLTARAFDLNTASAYLSLLGISDALVDRFTKHYPNKVRATVTTHHGQRQRRRTDC